MRFAWYQERNPTYSSQAQRFPHPAFVTRFLYNLAFWVFLLPLVAPVSYGTAFVAFTAVIGVRLLTNLYHNNVMPQTTEAFDRAWLRIPR